MGRVFVVDIKRGAAAKQEAEPLPGALQSEAVAIAMCYHLQLAGIADGEHMLQLVQRRCTWMRKTNNLDEKPAKKKKKKTMARKPQNPSEEDS